MEVAVKPEGRLTEEVLLALMRPFDWNDVKFLPKDLDNKDNPTRASALAYLNRKPIIERLNEVVKGDWSDEYRVIRSEPTWVVECKLTICGVTRTNVGEASSEAEAAKAAYSDAFKRAASEFGVGLYLAALAKNWCAGKQFGKSFYWSDDAPPAEFFKRSHPDLIPGQDLPAIIVPHVVFDRYGKERRNAQNVIQATQAKPEIEMASARKPITNAMADEMERLIRVKKFPATIPQEHGTIMTQSRAQWLAELDYKAGLTFINWAKKSPDKEGANGGASQKAAGDRQGGNRAA